MRIVTSIALIMSAMAPLAAFDLSKADLPEPNEGRRLLKEAEGAAAKDLLFDDTEVMAALSTR